MAVTPSIYANEKFLSVFLHDKSKVHIHTRPVRYLAAIDSELIFLIAKNLMDSDWRKKRNFVIILQR